jgi:hypothetical protein
MNNLEKHLKILNNSKEYVIKHNIQMSDEIRESIKKQGYWLDSLYTNKISPITDKQRKFRKVSNIIRKELSIQHTKSLYITLRSINYFKINDVCKIFLKLKVTDKIFNKLEKNNVRKLNEKFFQNKLIDYEEKKSIDEKLKLKKVSKKLKIDKKPELNSNPFIKRKKEKPKINFGKFKLKKKLNFYIEKIIGLSEEEKKIILKKFYSWNKLFNEDFLNLTEKEKSYILSLNDEYHGSDKEILLFKYFYNCVENINSIGKGFNVIDNSFYTREGFKQMKKIMYGEMKKNHRE